MFVALALSVATSALARGERSYDPNHNLLEVRAPEGRVTRFAYDGRNLVTAVTRGVGTPLEQRAASSSSGRRSTTRSPARSRRSTGCGSTREPAPSEPPQGPPPEAVQLTRSVVYDDLSRPVSVTDRRGYATSFEYDSAGRLAATEDALDSRLEVERDTAANPVVERTIERLPGGGTYQVETAHAYDALGRPVRTTDALGNVSQLHFDARGNLLREIDAEGHLTSTATTGSIGCSNRCGRATSRRASNTTLRPAGRR